MRKMVSGCGECSSHVFKDHFLWLFEAMHFPSLSCPNGISALKKQPLPEPKGLPWNISPSPTVKACTLKKEKIFVLV